MPTCSRTMFSFLDGVCSGVIDFYFACNYAFAFYDLANSHNAWCFEPDASFNMTKGMALLAGYERVRAAVSRASVTRCPFWRADRLCAFF